jgi:hypothetical protein
MMVADSLAPLMHGEESVAEDGADHQPFPKHSES